MKRPVTGEVHLRLASIHGQAPADNLRVQTEERRMVDQTCASWNHIHAFLRRIEAFRDACRERRSARFVPPPFEARILR